MDGSRASKSFYSGVHSRPGYYESSGLTSSLVYKTAHLYTMAAADVVSARAIVCIKEAPGEKVGSNWALQDVKVRAPKDGELRVRIKYSGICHTGKSIDMLRCQLSEAYRSLTASQISSLAAGPMAPWAAPSPRS